ncbi:hypothetical protein SK128_011150, partial [Halocaridina rubra]
MPWIPLTCESRIQPMATDAVHVCDCLKIYDDDQYATVKTNRRGTYTSELTLSHNSGISGETRQGLINDLIFCFIRRDVVMTWDPLKQCHNHISENGIIP